MAKVLEPTPGLGQKKNTLENDENLFDYEKCDADASHAFALRRGLSMSLKNLEMSLATKFPLLADLDAVSNSAKHVAAWSPHSRGRKAVHRFAALIIASAAATTTAQAQIASELRLSGTVEKLDGNLVALSLSQGISLVVRLDSEPQVNSVAKGSGSDLKAGSQVSAQAKRGQGGGLIATQIVLFAPGSNRPDAEPASDNAQWSPLSRKQTPLPRDLF
jgi:hypothetical protein